MKTIIFATGFERLESEIMRLLNQSGGNEIYQQIGYATHRDNILAICRQKKPSILVIHDELPGKTSFQELVRSLKVEIPDIRIVVITKERSIGDSLLSILTMYGVYDFISKDEVRPSEIAGLIMKPNTFADIEKYAPIARQEDSEHFSFETKMINTSAGGQGLEDIVEQSNDIADNVDQNMKTAFSGGAVPEIALEEDTESFVIDPEYEVQAERVLDTNPVIDFTEETEANEVVNIDDEEQIDLENTAVEYPVQLAEDDLPLFSEQDQEESGELDPEEFHARLNDLISHYQVDNQPPITEAASFKNKGSNADEMVPDARSMQLTEMTDKTLMKYIAFMESSLKDQMIYRLDTENHSNNECLHNDFEKLKQAISEYKQRRGISDPDCSWLQQMFEKNDSDSFMVIASAKRPIIYKDGGMIIIPNMADLPETDRKWLIECLKEGLPPKPPVKKKKTNSSKGKASTGK